MPRLSVTDIIIAIVIGIAVLLAIGWVVSPLIFKKDIETATNQIVVTTEEATEEKEEASKERNRDAAQSIQETQHRVVVAVSAAANSSDGDAAFFDFVCNSRLYKADPQRESKGCGGR